MVMIYGNPEGLKSLAWQLIEYANFQQSETGRDPGENWHLFPEHQDPILQSIEITVGRMDDRRTGETEWLKSLLDDTQQRLQDQISRLAD